MSKKAKGAGENRSRDKRVRYERAKDRRDAIGSNDAPAIRAGLPRSSATDNRGKGGDKR